MIVSLVTRNGKPITVGAGKHCFALENNQVTHSESQRLGSELKGPKSLAEYNQAFDLAKFAWEIQSFDAVENH